MTADMVVTGGSKGLGKEIARALAAEGANITLCARNVEHLRATQGELASVATPQQRIETVAVDLSIASDTEDAFRSLSNIPDTLYCVAGGATVENGFLGDIRAKDLESCMRNNYFTSAYAAQAMLKLWLEEDARKKGPSELGEQIHRRIVFISSAAAFVGIPGYIAYTPAKAAVRALADTLRCEVMQYSSTSSPSRYSIHCAFPSNFITDSFLEEQKYKPELTKKMEGTTATSKEELVQQLPSAQSIATRTVRKVNEDEFVILDDMVSGLLFANMKGPSPGRGWGILDFLLSIVATVTWPSFRWYLEGLCKQSKATEE